MHPGRQRHARSTKAGARTPATLLEAERAGVRQAHAQRRPGREPRRHPMPTVRCPRVSVAQRRPGREPRRHGEAGWVRRPEHDRSTKAGARTPATLKISLSTSSIPGAQRRPGREPRRHPSVPPHRPTATPLNEGRGANPGDTLCAGIGPRSARTLNEGRGANPGDTRSTCPRPPRWSGAQRRPGREPRRHRAAGAAAGARAPLNEGRGANPGDTPRTGSMHWSYMPVAQRRPGREPRRHASRASHRRCECGSLNEGRGANPGDTAPPPAAGTRRWRPLNEGRGANPGDTSRSLADSSGGRTLNEGRGANPGDTSESTVSLWLRDRAQRRPGREPRRHLYPGFSDPMFRVPLNEGRGANPGDTRRSR